MLGGLYGYNKANEFRYELQSGQSVNIIFNKSGDWLNYGFSNLYIMDRSNIPALRTWWEDVESRKPGECGILKDREEKSPGVYGVNALFRLECLKYR